MTTPPIDPTELSKLQSRWRHDALGVLEVIHGYSELLMQNAFGELQPKQQEVVDKIHQYSLRAVAAWQFMGAYIAVRYEQKPSTWQSINLQSLVERVLVNLAQVEGIQDVSLKLPSEPVLVQANYYLEQAFYHLLGPDGPMRLAPVPNTPRALHVTIQPNVVIVQILTSFGLHQLDQNQLTQVEMFEEGTAYDLAQLILTQHGCKLQYYSTPQHTVFRFMLTRDKPNKPA
jgi:light-regulated signal transduction histidine kinase (bacteriophytochrome)